MGSCILPDDQKSGKISSRTNLRQLWRRCNIRFLINGLVCTATVRFVFLCDPETWPSETYIQCFSTFKHSSIDIIMWEHWIGNSEVRRQVVGRMVPSLTGTLNEDRLMRLMFLRMSTEYLPSYALFSEQGNSWKIGEGGQSMTWRKCMKSHDW